VSSPVPVITYVHPGGARAASAGTYMLYASHLAAMSPGTKLGASTLVAFTGALPCARDDDADKSTGEDTKPAGKHGQARETRTKPDSAMNRKMVNDAVAYIRALAVLRGRNADWA